MWHADVSQYLRVCCHLDFKSERYFSHHQGQPGPAPATIRHVSMHNGTTIPQLQVLSTPELLADILDHLASSRDRKTLDNASLVGHVWRTEALKILWRSINMRQILRLLGPEGPLSNGAVS